MTSPFENNSKSNTYNFFLYWRCPYEALDVDTRIFSTKYWGSLVIFPFDLFVNLDYIIYNIYHVFGLQITNTFLLSCAIPYICSHSITVSQYACGLFDCGTVWNLGFVCLTLFLFYYRPRLANIDKYMCYVIFDTGVLVLQHSLWDRFRACINLLLHFTCRCISKLML